MTTNTGTPRERVAKRLAALEVQIAALEGKRAELAARIDKLEQGCANCGGDGKQAARGLCWACYRYEHRVGKPRPLDLRKSRPCANCARYFGGQNGPQCSRCVEYLKRHGREWVPGQAKPAVRSCTNCGRLDRARLDRCQACYRYRRLHGRDIDPRQMQIDRRPKLTASTTSPT